MPYTISKIQIEKYFKNHKAIRNLTPFHLHLSRNNLKMKTPDKDILNDILRSSQANNTRNEDTITITAEEAQQFQKAFQDEKFRKLMSDYVSDISDPKYRAEQNEYIRQLEMQQKIPEGKQIVRPTPGFVLKFKYSTKDKMIDSNTWKDFDPKSFEKKLFINIVTSEKIDKPRQENKNLHPKKNQSQWIVPYSLGPLRMEKDKSKCLTPTFDCCFHPIAIAYVKKITGFKELIVKSAKDGAIKQFLNGSKEEIIIHENYTILKGVAYKNDIPPIMLISSSSFHNEYDKNIPKLLKKIQKYDESKVNQNMKPQSKENNTKTPKFSLTERNSFQFIKDSAIDGSSPNSLRPAFLVYRIELPEIKTSSDIELEISPRKLILKTLVKKADLQSNSYYLEQNLPYSVDSNNATKAQWDKGKHELTITIPVQKP